ncbi:alpha/beta fold hydrolase [Campylobacter sp. 19-13652]|uniref:alpha/beta fold hydrolase n=1 Tax=Campylobacter sp. 19-13652 TaxID=2840180 RepID=UPI001C74DAA3|nr:alpha/beta hydrolase [Campylobacter sp. 19-13652]BCX79474.1 hydrolase [Campylobacter sp. 19-13652]
MASREVLLNSENFTISYEIIRPDNQKNSEYSAKLEPVKTVLFLHGWGAKKELMKGAFAPYFKKCLQIYLDMPGFGASKEPKNPMNTKDYVDVICCFLKDLDIMPNMIIAHSFGGKVAALLCQKISAQSLILLSTAGIPEPKRLSVRLKIAIFKLAKALGFGKLRRYFASDDAKSMSETMYETFKNVVNEDFREHFAALNLDEVLIFWGESDSAVSTKAAKELKNITPNSSLKILSGDHFFFLNHAKEIANDCLKREVK